MNERIVVPGLMAAEQATLDELYVQLRARTPRNVLRSAFYDGRRAVTQLGTIIPPVYHRTAFVLGWSGKAVDVLARRCNLTGFSWATGDLDALGQREVWDGNRLGSEIDSAIVSSLIHGVSFLTASSGDGDGPPASVHVRDALHSTGAWNWRSRQLDSFLSITDYGDNHQPTGLYLYLPGVVIEAEKDGARWQVDRRGHGFGVPVEPMVYRPRAGRPFGSSRISRPIMSLHDQALRAVVRLEAHADIYSFPQMLLLGADESIFRSADGSIKPAWQIALGRIFGIPDDDEAENPRADVKQFQAASPEPHLAHLNALAKMFAREASLPDTSVAITDVSNPTSAESYDASQYELIAESEGATDDWSRPICRTNARALAMANGMTSLPTDWASINADWRDPRYLSRSAEADAGLKQIQAAPWLAETEVGLQLLGLSAQQIDLALAQRQRAQNRQTLAALGAVSAQQQ